MKTKQILQRFGLLLFVAFLGSCEQEPLSEPAEDQANFTGKASARIGVYKNMLEFPDVETFLNTLEELEDQLEAYDDAFLDEWGHLDDESLDEKEDELKYDPAQPLIDFENQFSEFSSLRKKISAEEEIWLNNE